VQDPGGRPGPATARAQGSLRRGLRRTPGGRFTNAGGYSRRASSTIARVRMSCGAASAAPSGPRSTDGTSAATASARLALMPSGRATRTERRRWFRAHDGRRDLVGELLRSKRPRSAPSRGLRRRSSSVFSITAIKRRRKRGRPRSKGVGIFER